MKFLSKNFGATVAAAMLVCCSFSSQGAATYVIVGGPGDTAIFSPSVVEINTGDQIVWTWAYADHTSTSGSSGLGNGLWDSSGTSFTYTFTNAGIYPYFCAPHWNVGMTGEVIVASVVTVPSVQITSPTNGSVYAAPANVTMQATASDSGGTITNVQFRAGLTVLTNETAGPFAATANITSAGSSTFSAIASDSGGVKATNSVTINVVAPSPLVVSAPARSGTANFQFMYSANAGLNYIVQRSTNLLSANWQALATNTASGSAVSFTDKNATVSPGFYRVSRLPNP